MLLQTHWYFFFMVYFHSVHFSDLFPLNGFPFGAKSFGKGFSQFKFGLDSSRFRFEFAPNSRAKLVNCLHIHCCYQQTFSFESPGFQTLLISQRSAPRVFPFELELCHMCNCKNGSGDEKKIVRSIQKYIASSC